MPCDRPQLVVRRGVLVAVACRRPAAWRLTQRGRSWAVCDGCRAPALAVLTARGLVEVAAYTDP